jgi:GTPase
MEPTDENREQATETRAGYVALLGYPNAGKSSLLNRLLEQKLSIVTPLPQTTRERVVGIETRDGAQMVFLDTPGLVEPKYLLHSSMRHAALDAVRDADVVVVLADPLQRLPEPDAEPFASLARSAREAVVAVNKVDIAPREQVQLAREWAASAGFERVMEVSAETGEGVESLRSRIRELLPVSPYLYPPDEISAQPVRFFTAEFVRESIFELYRDEVPYSVAVKVEEFREDGDPVYVRAVIFVERASQKGILIGAGGSGIRELGRSAREKIEAFIGSRVYLDLWVKVLPRWRKDAGSLRNLGYQLPPSNHA